MEFWKSKKGKCKVNGSISCQNAFRAGTSISTISVNQTLKKHLSREIIFSLFICKTKSTWHPNFLTLSKAVVEMIIASVRGGDKYSNSCTVSLRILKQSICQYKHVSSADNI